MAEKRIIDLAETTQFSSTDYLVVDSETNGTKKMPTSLITNAIGAPFKASTVAEMTDTSRVYVYTGSESGYTSGNWYYYNDSSWVSGGVYNATAVVTDPTLTQVGEPADAKATGDEIADLKSEINNDFKYIVGKTNLLYNASFTKGYSINAVGTITPSTGFAYSSLIPVEAKDYVLVWQLIEGIGNLRVHGYDSNGSWVKQIDYNNTGAPIEFSGKGINAIRISFDTVSHRLVCLSEPPTVYDEMKTLKSNFDIPVTVATIQAWEIGKAISANGEISTNSEFKISDTIGVTADTEYLIKYIVAEDVSRTIRVHGYKNGVWVKQLAMKNAKTTAYQSVSFVADDSIDGVRISCSRETMCAVYALSPMYDEQQPLYYVTPAITYQDHYSISATGVVTASNDWKASDFIECNGNYITLCFINYGPYDGNVRVHAYDSSENWIEQIYAKSIQYVTHGNEVRSYFTFKPLSTYKYIRISAPRLTDVGYFEHDDAKEVDFNFFVTGDGVTDDTVAAQLAFQLAAGRTLKVGQGTYKITGTMHIPTDININGIQNKSVFMLADGYSLDTVVWRGNSKGYCVFLTDENAKNIVVDGITINGTTNDIRAIRMWGIVAYYATNVLIKNCSVNYMNYDPDLDELQVEYQPGYGIHIFHSSKVRIVGGTYDYNGYEHIGVEHSDDVTVDSVYMGTAWRVPFQIHRGGKNVKLVNSTIKCTECTRAHSLVTFHGIPDYMVENVVIANNILKGVFTPQWNRGGIQTVQGDERNIIVIGNNFDTVGEGIHNKSNFDDSPASAGIWVVANNIFNAQSKGITINAPHVICVGNYVCSPSGTQINITSADGVVENNIVVNR